MSSLHKNVPLNSRNSSLYLFALINVCKRELKDPVIGSLLRGFLLPMPVQLNPFRQISQSNMGVTRCLPARNSIDVTLVSVSTVAIPDIEYSFAPTSRQTPTHNEVQGNYIGNTFYIPYHS
ncbi:hypothetical protein FKM82_022439 [Ascaphus truei]